MLKPCSKCGSDQLAIVGIAKEYYYVDQDDNGVLTVTKHMDNVPQSGKLRLQCGACEHLRKRVSALDLKWDI